ncbi:SOS response-associated peptidase family protein [Bosea sp. BE125]|uniref:SOS response-associated peptidase n=1 Tax=Bosea sp. BE125 TaxID=2817909 RepID=UPI00286C6FD2|nr:SOS response-associated peptidase family protein [Bosea sp. BE125]
MCNLYSMTKGQAAIIALARAMRNTTGNLPPMPGIFPDYPAPIVRNAPDGVRELAMVRWGMPSSKRVIFDAAKKRAGKLEAKGKPVDFEELLKMEPDGGTTNVRNTSSNHWKPWLGVESRCVVLLTSFSEFDHGTKQDVWFALAPDRLLAFFAGIWTPTWTGVRKIKTGIETTDLFAFLTTEPNREVGAVHPKAMPVILTTPEECETWMTAPWELARGLQRPLPDGTLEIVARGLKKDEAGYV